MQWVREHTTDGEGNYTKCFGFKDGGDKREFRMASPDLHQAVLELHDAGFKPVREFDTEEDAEAWAHDQEWGTSDDEGHPRVAVRTYQRQLNARRCTFVGEEDLPACWRDRFSFHGFQKYLHWLRDHDVMSASNVDRCLKQAKPLIRGEGVKITSNRRRGGSVQELFVFEGRKINRLDIHLPSAIEHAKKVKEVVNESGRWTATQALGHMNRYRKYLLTLQDKPESSHWSAARWGRYLDIPRRRDIPRRVPRRR